MGTTMSLVDDLKEAEKLCIEMAKNRVPLGEVHLIETSEGKINIQSKVFEKTELIGVLYACAILLMDEKNTKCDLDIFREQLCSMIFDLMKDKNKYIELIKHWKELLSKSGINSKSIVINEMEETLKEIEVSNNETN